MGYLNSEHIQNFVAGQTVEALIPDPEAAIAYRLVFESGESLRLYPDKHGCECCRSDIVATPYDEKGQVKPSTVIMRGKM